MLKGLRDGQIKQAQWENSPRVVPLGVALSFPHGFASRPEAWQAYKGKRVRVGGMVKMRNGKPAIALKQANFLRVMW
ncbi:MAG: hypothetical protein ACOYMN_17610 [Roseimicrobium sp.]